MIFAVECRFVLMGLSSIGHVTKNSDPLVIIDVDRLYVLICDFLLGHNFLPQALAQMKNHRNLGIHTEMFSDRVVDLVKVGAITNTQKVG